MGVEWNPISVAKGYYYARERRKKGFNISKNIFESISTKVRKENIVWCYIDVEEAVRRAFFGVARAEG